MINGQTSFRNDFERKFWADVYVAHLRPTFVLASRAAEHADEALSELRKREQPTYTAYPEVAP